MDKQWGILFLVLLTKWWYIPIGITFGLGFLAGAIFL